MHVKVKLYFQLKEKAGSGEIEMELPEKASILNLKQELKSRYPQLNAHLKNVLVLMNQKIVLDDDLIKENAEISFLPPIGGG